MSLDAAPDFLVSSPRLPTDRDLRRLSEAIETAGRDKGFSGRRIDRYRAWIQAFVSWCFRDPPYHIDSNQIGDFWQELRERSGAEKPELAEAMDALGFLFGSLGNPEQYFSYGDEAEASRSTNGPSHALERTTRLNSSVRTESIVA